MGGKNTHASQSICMMDASPVGAGFVGNTFARKKSPWWRGVSAHKTFAPGVNSKIKSKNRKKFKKF